MFYTCSKMCVNNSINSRIPIVLKMYLNDTVLIICIAVTFGLNNKKSKENKRKPCTKDWYKRRAHYRNLLDFLRMTGRSRYNWMHSIINDRTSIWSLINTHKYEFTCSYITILKCQSKKYKFYLLYITSSQSW